VIINNFINILRVIGKIAIGVFLTYAVIFSIVGTIAIIYAYSLVMSPVLQVQYLKNHNPKETAFMKDDRYDQNKKGVKSLGSLGSPNLRDSISQVFVPLGSISRNLRNAVIAAEDDGFYTHPGFDVEAILGAYEYNRNHNKIVRGGSTITQQLAKNLFLSNDKKFLRKFKELGYTLLLEKILDKDRILELYLNYAQWGDNIYGCEAASLHYYKKPSARLTLSEATRLAASLASPERLTPLNERSGFLQKRIAVIADNLYKKHLYNDSDFIDAFGFKPSDDSSTVILPVKNVVPPPSIKRRRFF
jgi:monofunctional biosynthetic peptidoglycan transglycosylase